MRNGKSPEGWADHILGCGRPGDRYQGLAGQGSAGLGDGHCRQGRDCRGAVEPGQLPQAVTGAPELSGTVAGEPSSGRR